MSAAEDASIRAVLFDLDGTLADSLETIAEAMSAAFALHGHEMRPAEIIPRIGPPMNVLAQETAGVSEEAAERINDDYLRLYHDDYVDRTPERPGATALLERLAEHDLRMGVVTNKVEYGARRVVEVCGWERYLPVIVGRDTAAAPKPSVEASFFALRALGVPPEQAAIVGDTEFDMQCGRDSGLALVIGLLGARSEEHLRATGATHVVASLAEAGDVILGTRATTAETPA